MQSRLSATILSLAGTIAVTLAATPAFAHSGAGMAGGIASGFLHPLGGLDHIVAMVAVGLWGAILGRPAIYLLPITFPLVMAFGGTLGIAGVPLPFVETGIALSGIVLGLMVALFVRPPLWLAMALVGVFAIFHGYAHGAELPSAANPAAYAVGFVLATGLLHLAGILIGALVGLSFGKTMVRAGGALIALTGAAFLAGLA